MWWNVPEAEDKRTESPPAKVLALAGAVRRRQRAVLTMLPLGMIEPNRLQPRKFFDDEKLAELAESIKERGLIQPIVVRRAEQGYELLAGERRFRAARLAEQDRIPALIREKDDPLELALIENIQREDLSPLEEAEAFSRLIEAHGYSHRELAEVVGKSRPYVSNALSLLRLPAVVKDEIHRQGRNMSRELLMGIARSETPEEAEALWARLKLDLMSVRRFRAERSGDGRPARSAARELLSAARRLNRCLKKYAEGEYSTGQVRGSQDEIDTLRRVLQRSRRLIDQQIAQQIAAECPAAEPAPVP